MTTTLPAPADAAVAGTSRRHRQSGYHLEILLVSVSVLLTEISYTRVVSFKLFYYYVYLVIGLALLGLGAGAVIVAVVGRLRRVALDAVLFWSMVIGACATVAAYAVVAAMRIDTLKVWEYGTSGSIINLALIMATCLCVFSSFVGAGVAIAALFSRRTESIGGLYAADLAGAALACATVVFIVSWVGAPATIMLSAAVLAGASFRVAVRLRGSLAALAGLVLAACLALAIAPNLLPTQQVDSSKPFVKPANPAIASGWGSVFRVDVAPAGKSAPNVLNLYHDGTLGASIYRWNGKRASLSAYDFPQDPRSIPFSVLGGSPTHEAVIGAAGGHEVLASLYFAAKHVDAVELNPVTVDLVRNRFADFDGHLAQNPAVDYINADGRSYMARTAQHDDLIWYPAPDSYAATNSALASANVLSESYLYTTNAMVTNLQHLTGRGIFVAQFGEDDNVHDLRTTRFVATARQALRQLGVDDPRDHILVAETQTHFLSIPLSTIVVSLRPFTPAQIGSFASAVHRVPNSSTLYAPGQAVGANPVNSVVTVPDSGLSSFYRTFPYDVTPTTDNGPYFWHFARFGTVIGHYAQSLSSSDREDSVGERVLLLLLAISVLAALVFLLVPFVVVRSTWSRMPAKRWSCVFFGGVGLGFIFFEITLMQRLNLFLGFPTYSLTVTLAALLLFTGVGALISRQVARADRAIPVLLGAVVALGLFYLVGMPPLTDALLSLPLTGRIAVTFAMLAPLGVCLGMFMPLGLRTVSGGGETGRTYVAWGWAVNAFASVVGSALATILSMEFGFDAVLVLAMGAYAIATAAWLVLARRFGRGAPADPSLPGRSLSGRRPRSRGRAVVPS